jgi:hypothetical protein
VTRDEDRREGFLGRWTRLKREAQQPAAGAPPALDAPAPAVAAPADQPQGDDGPPPPDLASIDADTDITPWLTRTVSEEWKNAALRQVWATTPGIRDFKGLQDYDWDFNNPDSIPGFGEYVNPESVRDIIANLFGPAPSAPEGKTDGASVEAVAPDSAPATGEAGSDPAAIPDAVRLGETQATPLAALQPPEAEPEPEETMRPGRRGGRALPA